MKLEHAAERLMVNPLYQASAVFGLIVIFVGIDKLFGASGMIEGEANMPWVISLAMVLFYALFNSIFSLKATRITRYFSHSILGYMGLVIAGFTFSWLISSLTIDEAGSFRWLIVVMTFGYLIFLSIVRLIKRIVDIAMKQDKRLRGEEDD